MKFLNKLASKTLSIMAYILILTPLLLSSVNVLAMKGTMAEDKLPDINLYTAIELLPSASNTEIKKSILRLQKKWHPDKKEELSASEQVYQEQRWDAINAARRILMNDTLKVKYDEKHRFGTTTARANDKLLKFSGNCNPQGLAEVKSALSNGADIASIDTLHNNRTALLFAVEANCPSIVTVLIESARLTLDADSVVQILNSVDTFGMTALMRAISLDSSGTLTETEEARDLAGAHHTKEAHEIELTRLVRNRKQEADKSLEIFTTLLKVFKKSPTKLAEFVNFTPDINPKKQTPLMYAAISSSLNVLHYLRELISDNANIDAQNSDGMTALMLAVRRAYQGEASAVEKIKILLTADADKDLRDTTGKTALDIANESLKSANSAQSRDETPTADIPALEEIIVLLSDISSGHAESKGGSGGGAGDSTGAGTGATGTSAGTSGGSGGGTGAGTGASEIDKLLRIAEQAASDVTTALKAGNLGEAEKQAKIINDLLDAARTTGDDTGKLKRILKISKEVKAEIDRFKAAHAGGGGGGGGYAESKGGSGGGGGSSTGTSTGTGAGTGAGTSKPAGKPAGNLDDLQRELTDLYNSRFNNPLEPISRRIKNIRDGFNSGTITDDSYLRSLNQDLLSPTDSSVTKLLDNLKTATIMFFVDAQAKYQWSSGDVANFTKIQNSLNGVAQNIRDLYQQIEDVALDRVAIAVGVSELRVEIREIKRLIASAEAVPTSTDIHKLENLKRSIDRVKAAATKELATDLQAAEKSFNDIQSAVTTYLSVLKPWGAINIGTLPTIAMQLTEIAAIVQRRFITKLDRDLEALKTRIEAIRARMGSGGAATGGSTGTGGGGGASTGTGAGDARTGGGTGTATGGGAGPSSSTGAGASAGAAMPIPVKSEDYKNLLGAYKISSDLQILIAIYKGFAGTGKDSAGIIRILGSQLHVPNNAAAVIAKLATMITDQGGTVPTI